MRKLGWYAVSAIVIALILGGVLLLGANLYVQSVTVQHRIREALEANLKMPVSLRKTTITPWDGLRIDGIVARIEGLSRLPLAPDFLDADSFRVRFGWLPIFSHQFVVCQVLLDHPRLAWPQNADGRWMFPPQERGPRVKKPRQQPEGQPPSVAQASPAPPGVSGSPPPTPAIAASSPAVTQGISKESKRAIRPPPGFTISVDHFRLRHGTMDFLDAKDRPLGRFEEVNVNGHLPDLAHATGEYWFEKAELPRADLLLTNFHGSFAYVRDTELDLADGYGEMAGGHVLLTFHLQMGDPGSPFAAECHVEDVSLERLFAEAGSKVNPIQGRLVGNLNVSGLSGKPSSRVASGHFQLLDTHLNNMPLLQAFGDALRIRDLSHLQFRKADLDCKLHGTILDLDPLILESRDFQISVRGQFHTDEDRLDLHARLVIDESISNQLPQFLGGNFTPCGGDAPGSCFIDFTITGPLNKPSTNLFDRALSTPVNSLFQNLFAPKPKSSTRKSPKHNDNAEPPSDSDANDT